MWVQSLFYVHINRIQHTIPPFTLTSNRIIQKKTPKAKHSIFHPIYFRTKAALGYFMKDICFQNRTMTKIYQG